ncbi:MAG: T9SS type A sorting domain-containing protein [Chitinophagaceae bacterium]|nr:T9SS type A sorting domain-containing protein [Chitinophagaceae bacterium]
MKRLLLTSWCLLFVTQFLFSQLLTWTPDFAKDNDNITITVDATKGNQGLQNYNPTTDVYVHVGLITSASTSNTDWRYSKFTWGTATAAAQATYLGNNKWQYTITNIRAFFNAPAGVPAGETIRKIAILFRNGTGSVVQRNTDGSDMYIPVYDNTIAVRFSAPAFQPTFTPISEPISKQVGDNINVTGIANQSADMKIYLNGSAIQTATGVTTISANPTITTSGNNEIVVEATASAVTKKDTLRFFVAPGVNIAPLPAGVRDGINYAVNNTEVTLVLYAPGKNRVSVIGEFTGSNWAEQSQYIMNKTPDGNYWWITITGLTSGQEYAFQYLVDGNLKIAEPYAEKILDPGNDGSITSSTYPNLKPYPAGQTGMVSVLQTNPPAYSWSVSNFSRPDKRNLVIYELLLRDFIQAHDWKTLKDTLNYLKNLGVNAIEVMPFNEFEGNLSWGYNPFQYFALDKYYGPKNNLKEFIDSCHKKGIAVIMDIVLNHTYGPSPLARLYWDAQNNRPAANNPWYNPVAPTAFGFGEDFNHSSTATVYFFNRVLQYWLTEYKIDGYRFDFSKGLTQTPSTSDAGFSAYDASRIAIINNYANTIKAIYPDAYIILEHFCADNEEKELSDNGYMLWSNVWTQYQEASMGYISNSNFERGIYTARNWQNPHLVTFMESHDEERITYKNIKYGNSSGSYNIKTEATALNRMELNAAFMLTIPGPKMIWEFGELGYDFSRCHLATNGEGGDCNTKTDPKPIRWDYLQVIQRKRVYDIYSSINKLRFHGWYKDVFTGNNINLARNLSGAFKTITIRSANDTSMLCVIGNFDVTAQTASITLPAAGTWYDYLNGTTFTATGAAQSITLQPGEYHIYLNRNLVNAVTTPVIDINNPGNDLQVFVYPNPVGSNSISEIYVPEKGNVQLDILNAQGQKVAVIFTGVLPKGKHIISLSGKTNNLPAGMYLLKVQTRTRVRSLKLLITAH